jgi:hypothetical protein
LARAVLAAEGRAELSRHWADRLAAELALPRFELPFLFTERFGREAIERISRVLEGA